MQKATCDDAMLITSHSSMAARHHRSLLLLTFLVTLQWLAIASMGCFVFFYIDVLKKDVNYQVLMEMKNFSSPNFQPAESSLVKKRAQKPIAHFTALADFQNSSSLLFETSLGHAFAMAGMSSDKGTYLVIPTSGVYFVYTQVTYICQRDCQAHARQFSASVWKKNRRYPDPETLMKGHTKPPAKTDTFLKISTYQAGAFKLDAEDRLYVEVPKNLIKNVAINEAETYFGAFLLEHSTLE